ncbi:DUF6441 family protein [Calidifontimicrobium sp. SYSU G02091]|jgi:hypothetical protein|uniref:DUF6441 family protein n=1 Tax=Pseudomonadota TaxID=1224 RepID=UPI0011CBBD68|nr:MULTISPECIES: DUF6441 family protein [Pseudomonadota]MCI1192356.1 DUF6441 family protein [Calidifontimicrobium sp. SYSU G02091]
MKLTLATSGLLDPRQLSAWSTQRRRAIHAAVAKGMAVGGREVREAARAQMRSAFEVRRASFVSSMQTKVFDRKPERLPALWVGSRIPWLGIHTQGGTVSGNLLIPLLSGRIGPKRFKAVIDGLMRSGNAFFVEKDGRVLLMAENLQENAAQLNRFKRAERQRSGVKRLQRGQEIPIAVLVRRVDLKRRFDLGAAVQPALSGLARAIQRELDQA